MTAIALVCFVLSVPGAIKTGVAIRTEYEVTFGRYSDIKKVMAENFRAMHEAGQMSKADYMTNLHRIQVHGNLIDQLGQEIRERAGEIASDAVIDFALDVGTSAASAGAGQLVKGAGKIGQVTLTAQRIDRGKMLVQGVATTANASMSLYGIGKGAVSGWETVELKDVREILEKLRIAWQQPEDEFVRAIMAARVRAIWEACLTRPGGRSVRADELAFHKLIEQALQEGWKPPAGMTFRQFIARELRRIRDERGEWRAHFVAPKMEIFPTNRALQGERVWFNTVFGVAGVPKGVVLGRVCLAELIVARNKKPFAARAGTGRRDMPPPDALKQYGPTYQQGYWILGNYLTDPIHLDFSCTVPEDPNELAPGEYEAAVELWMYVTELDEQRLVADQRIVRHTLRQPFYVKERIGPAGPPIVRELVVSQKGQVVLHFRWDDVVGQTGTATERARSDVVWKGLLPQEGDADVKLVFSRPVRPRAGKELCAFGFVGPLKSIFLEKPEPGTTQAGRIQTEWLAEARTHKSVWGNDPYLSINAESEDPKDGEVLPLDNMPTKVARFKNGMWDNYHKEFAASFLVYLPFAREARERHSGAADIFKDQFARADNKPTGQVKFTADDASVEGSFSIHDPDSYGGLFVASGTFKTTLAHDQQTGATAPIAASGSASRSWTPTNPRIKEVRQAWSDRTTVTFQAVESNKGDGYHVTVSMPRREAWYCQFSGFAKVPLKDVHKGGRAPLPKRKDKD